MTVTKEAVVEKLRSIRGQNMESDIVSLGLVSEIFIADSKVFFSVTVPAEKAREMEPLRAAAEAAVKSLPGVDGAVDQCDVGDAEQRQRAIVGDTLRSGAGEQLVEDRERITR